MVVGYVVQTQELDLLVQINVSPAPCCGRAAAEL